MVKHAGEFEISLKIFSLKAIQFPYKDIKLTMIPPSDEWLYFDG
jgi:hypothetical protein